MPRAARSSRRWSRRPIDPRELERTEERSVRSARGGRKYQRRSKGCRRWRTNSPPTSPRSQPANPALAGSRRTLRTRDADSRGQGSRPSKARIAAAKKLDKAVMTELAPLKLERAEFMTHIDSDPRQRDGRRRRSCRVLGADQSGRAARPPDEGRVGRRTRALHAGAEGDLADRGSAPTLVFDEIDTGVGGAVADAIGQRLARLASRVQVLAVTHAPQVAARAGKHFRIAKDEADKGKRVATSRLRSTRTSAARKSRACWPARPSPKKRGRRRRGCWKGRASLSRPSLRAAGEDSASGDSALLLRLLAMTDLRFSTLAIRAKSGA